jgi:hypothetical protein
MDNANKAIAFGMAAVGVYTAFNAFGSQFNKVERQGVTLAGVALLLGLGAVLVMRFDDAATKANRLLA